MHAFLHLDINSSVMLNTWGHLAPVKDKTYRGRVVYAIGCYDSGDLNPTPLICDFPGLSSSPWFYDAIKEWLSNLPESWRQVGCVYEWTGTMRNYSFDGLIRMQFGST